jgi:hypothetical protein
MSGAELKLAITSAQRYFDQLASDMKGRTAFSLAKHTLSFVPADIVVTYY